MIGDIINQSSSPMEILQSTRRVQRVRHELKRRDFVSLGFDDHVKFILGDKDGGDPVRRDYTPRAFDRTRRELTIDFALHGDGHASEWARQAAPGQQVVVGGPRGSMVVPTDYAWHLLAGDVTALPAISRRLEELPAGSHAIVVAQAVDVTPLERAQCAGRVERYQVATADEFIATLRALRLPDGEGYAWCAGEASTMARVREVLLGERALPREAMRVAAYWKRGASDYHDDLAA
jgi:NADPH-dependent ferric siderophore reductase